MTPEQVRELTDEQVNRTLLERLMRWEVCRGNRADGTQDKIHDGFNDFVCYLHEWHPSSNLQDAFLCLENIGKVQGTWGFFLAWDKESAKWRAGWGIEGVAVHRHPARAICNAILMEMQE